MAVGTIGKYERLDVLGHGTSGVVYLAWDTLLRRQVALKEIRAAGPDADRVLDEARVLDRLGRHPHIVEVHSVDVREGVILIDMELVRGGNLADLLRERKGEPLPPSEAVRITRAVLDALAYAHERRIVHRDIKPANILIGRDRAVKLTDFGLAEALGTGSVAGGGGTYPYMAPEDFASDAASDRRSDLWAVGVVLYEMLAGRRPFVIPSGRRADPFAWKKAIEEETPPPLATLRPELPPALDAILRRALAKDKAARYPSADAFADALQAVVPLLPAAVVSASPPEDATIAATVSPAAGVAANPAPFVFGGGAFAAYTLDDLLLGAAKHWDEARRALVGGAFEPFLHAIGEVYIAELAAELRQRPGSADQRLREFLSRSRADEADPEPAAPPVRPADDEEHATIPVSRAPSLLLPRVLPSRAPEVAPAASPPPAAPVAEAVPAAAYAATRWWFWPLFLLCLSPLVMALASSSHLSTRQQGRFSDIFEAWTVTGALTAMLLIVGIGARFSLSTRIVCGLPVAIGLIAAGALVSSALSAPMSPDLLLRLGGLVLLPVAVLLIEAATTQALWRIWAWVTLLGALAGAVHFLR